jgi:hypothetical protein
MAGSGSLHHVYGEQAEGVDAEIVQGHILKAFSEYFTAENAESAEKR